MAMESSSPFVALSRAAEFYDAVLEPLGVVRVWISEKAIGTASSRAAVDSFHTAALDHGGTDDGAPGLRTAYGPRYYYAFVRDPDGYSVEAVFHEPVGDGAGNVSNGL